MSYQKIRLTFNNLNEDDFVDYLLIGNSLTLTVSDQENPTETKNIELRSLSNHWVNTAIFRHEFETYFDWNGKTIEGKVKVFTNGPRFTGYIDATIESNIPYE